MLAGCKMLQTRYINLEMCLRGYGLKVGPTNRKTFNGRVREQGASVLRLDNTVDPLLKTRATLASARWCGQQSGSSGRAGATADERAGRRCADLADVRISPPLLA